MHKWFKLFLRFLSFTIYFKAALALFKAIGKTEEWHMVDGREHCHHISEAAGGPDHSHSSSSEPETQQESDQHDFCSYPTDRFDMNTCSLEVLRFGLDGGPASLQVQLGQKQSTTPAYTRSRSLLSPWCSLMAALSKQHFSLAVFQWHGASTASSERWETGISQLTGQSSPQPQQLHNISTRTLDIS